MAPKPDPLPTEVRHLLARLEWGTASVPSHAFEAAFFDRCRLPREARAGLLLFAGHLDESHRASQELKSREGYYWHAIFHRLEPDAWNAKYWFQKVGPHEIGPSLTEASRLAGWQPARSWDHDRFVDYESEARASKDEEQMRIAEEVQRAEWQLLFEFCAKDKSR